MSTSSAFAETTETLPLSLERVALDYAERWNVSCRQLIKWHRTNFLERAPTAEDRRGMERVLPWMLRTTRIIQGQLLDPQWPHPALARELEASLWQLQQVWEQTHNPMSADEADQVLAAVFPA